MKIKNYKVDYLNNEEKAAKKKTVIYLAFFTVTGSLLILYNIREQEPWTSYIIGLPIFELAINSYLQLKEK